MTIPTVGRVMLFTPAADDIVRFALVAHPDDAPDKLVQLDAHVVYVWPAIDLHQRVNLAVFDQAGNHHAVQGVRVIQDGELPEEGTAFVQWMPYQKAVAKGEIPPTLHAVVEPK